MSNFGHVHSSQQYPVCLSDVCAFGPDVANSELTHSSTIIDNRIVGSRSESNTSSVVLLLLMFFALRLSHCALHVFCACWVILVLP